MDDCSTDNSVKIVKSYFEKFEGKLKLLELKENSGNCGIPRNEGVNISRGEYIYFIDSDDLITNTALEELYNLARNLQADVIQMERIFRIPNKWEFGDKSPVWIEGTAFNNYNAKPTLLTSEKPMLLAPEFSKRLYILQKGCIHWSSFTKFINRNFIIKSSIKFVPIIIEDQL